MKTIHVSVAGTDVELPAEILTLVERLSWGTSSTPEEKLAEFVHDLIQGAKRREQKWDAHKERARVQRYCVMEGVDPKDLEMRETQQALRDMLHDLGVEVEGEGDELM